MASSYFESEAYQELVQAYRARDYALQGQIIERQVATTKGNENAFWLRVRLDRRVSFCSTPREFMNLKPDLEALLSVAAEDPEHIHSLATTAIHLYLNGEYGDALARVLPLLRPFRQVLSNSHGIRHNLGLLFAKKRRWHSAFRNLTLSLKLFDLLPKARQEAQGGYRYFVYTQQAIVAVALNRYDTAAESIAGAHAVMATRPPGYFHPAFVGLAEAALAHARGEYQLARSFLQTANATAKTGIPWVEFDFLLMAARMARSEGNLSSFHHFCQQARALCAKHDMPLSAAAVQAVANGAEY